MLNTPEWKPTVWGEQDNMTNMTINQMGSLHLVPSDFSLLFRFFVSLAKLAWSAGLFVKETETVGKEDEQKCDEVSCYSAIFKYFKIILLKFSQSIGNFLSTVLHSVSQCITMMLFFANSKSIFL